MTRSISVALPLTCLAVALALAAPPGLAVEPAARAEADPTVEDHGAMSMPATDVAQDSSDPMPTPMAMQMGSMQGGQAPPDARDPDAWADGYEYTGMPGFEQTDQLVFGTVLVDELELASGDEGEGLGWSWQAAYGGDQSKLWLRSQGLKVEGQPVDPASDLEVLHWRATGAFWGRTLGIRQDFGPDGHTWVAAGIQGLAPYWFELEATAYLAEDGRVAGRLKAAYDLRFTNRLILTPELEANAYSRADPARSLGSGLGNVELGLRLRYEVRRKFAPYVGIVWERAYGGTADQARARGDAATERRVVAGLRIWW